MPDPARSQTSWPHVLLVFGLLTFTAVTLASNVIPVRDAVRDTRAMLEQRESDNEAARRRIVELREEERVLREDPWVVRRVLREEFHRLDEGEITVR